MNQIIVHRHRHRPDCVAPWGEDDQGREILVYYGRAHDFLKRRKFQAGDDIDVTEHIGYLKREAVRRTGPDECVAGTIFELFAHGAEHGAEVPVNLADIDTALAYPEAAEAFFTALLDDVLEAEGLYDITEDDERNMDDGA